MIVVVFVYRVGEVVFFRSLVIVFFFLGLVGCVSRYRGVWFSELGDTIGIYMF